MNSNNEIVLSGYAVMRRICDFSKLYSNGNLDPLVGSLNDYRKLIKTGKKGDVFNLVSVLEVVALELNTSRPGNIRN